REDGSIWWQSAGDGYGDGGRFADLGECVNYFTLQPYRPGDILYVRETWRVGAWDIRRQMMAFDYADGTSGPLVYIADREMFMRLVDQSREDARKAKCIYNGVDFVWEKGKSPCRWRPSIHMPREAARIFLRVTDVRVERLQEMSMDDIRREGAVPSCVMCYYGNLLKDRIACERGIVKAVDCPLESAYPEVGFQALWDSTIKPADRERYGWAANPWVWVIAFERCEKPKEDA
ncbi:MAG: hypothetical protein IJV43_01610, partial [Oscillospiraceae bacterium]|nr:hypothetical protein [Oscillospiraceae bacterium]